MAANNTALLAATQTLVAATGYKVNLTGNLGSLVEIVHHGNVTDVVYYQIADLESELTGFTAAANEIGIVLPGERLPVGNIVGSAASLWVRLLSAGTATVTVTGKS